MSLAPIIVPIVFVLLMVVGTPLAAVLGLSALTGLILLDDPLRIAATSVGRVIGEQGLIAIPFYVLAGVLLEKSGIARALLRFLMALFGHIRGSLVVATGGASVVFGGVSGSGPADTSVLSLVFVPPMEKQGYPRAFGGALCAAGGSLGLIIPPSAGYILYAVITQRASIVDLFIAGILPGILMASAFVFAGLLASRRLAIETYQRAALREIIRTAPGALAGIGAPIVIVGGIYSGTFTVTESAGVAVVYACIVGGLVFRELKWSDFPDIAFRTGVATGVIFFIAGAAGIFGRLVSISGWADELSERLTSIASTPQTFLLVSLAIFLICGFILDGVTMYFILVPLALPAMDALGVDPVQYGVVITMAIAVGLITPPVGVDLFAAAGVIGNVTIERLARAAIPFAIAGLISALLVIFIPELTNLFL